MMANLQISESLVRVFLNSKRCIKGILILKIEKNGEFYGWINVNNNGYLIIAVYFNFYDDNIFLYSLSDWR